MPVAATAEVMVDIAVTVVATLSEAMPQAILKLDMLVCVLAVDTVTMLRGRRADTRAMQLAHIIGMAAVTGEVGTGEAITGEAVTGIRPMDILARAITAWAMAIHTTGLAITAIVTVDTIRTTEIGDTILTFTDSGPQ